MEGPEKTVNNFQKLGTKYVLSVMAACVAEFVTYPLDLTKTRLQIQGEVSSSHSNHVEKKKGMLRTAFAIGKEEGIVKLWQGISPSLARHVIYSGVRITVYEKMREEVVKNSKQKMSTHQYQKQMNDSRNQMSLHHRIICGMASGAIGQFCASPTDLVKVRMQMQGREQLQLIATKRQNMAIKSMGMMQMFLDVIKKGGVLGLWKGCVPNVQRAALVNLGDLTAYDQAKTFLVTNGFDPNSKMTHAMSSIAAALTAATMGTPADVIKTRIMNQPLDSNGKGKYYSGSIDCLKKTIANEGLAALYKGFVPCWLRMAPWSMTFWLSFEKFRNILGVETW